MLDVTSLKMEAKQLLDEVNHYTEIYSRDHKPWETCFAESVYKDHLFRERLKDLKRKVNDLDLNKIVLR